MPVRFRCQYCNQLLGIARRKIGTEVACPTCKNRVMVPVQDSPEFAVPAQQNELPLLERSDIDKILAPAVQVAAASPPPTAWAPAPPVFEPEPYLAPPPTVAAAGGVTLTPLHATLLTVAAVLVLAVAFAAGLLIGRFVL
jgi:phage FluMu protein Com